MFEAYKIGVKISLINNVTAGLLSISQHFARTNAQAVALQKNLHKIKMLGMAGAAIGGAGFLGLALLGKTVKPASEYAHQLALINTLGMKQADIAKVVAKAWETSGSVVTSSVTDNLEAFRELRSAFGAGHESHALAILPQVQMVKAILNSLTGKEQSHVGFDMVKAIELRSGVMTEAALKSNAGQMLQTLIAMGGTLNVNDYHQALKYGKAATMGWSDEFVYKYLPTLMQEVKTGHGGAQSAGTMLMTAYRAIVGGKMQKSAFQNWIASGLVGAGDVVKNATGQWQMKPGAVRGVDLFAQNPYEWSQKFLAPAVQKLMQSRRISEDVALSSLFSDRNAEFVMRTFLYKAQQFERDRKLIEQANSFDAYQKLLKTDPEMAKTALHKQWQNLLAIIGYQIMPDLIKGAQKLIPVLHDLARWFKDNPAKAKALVTGFAALSAALAFAGTVISIAASFKALKLVFSGLGRWIVTAGMTFLRFLGPTGWIITAVIGLGVLVYKNWDTIKKYTGMAFDWMIGKAKWLWDHIKSLGSSVGHWISKGAQMGADGFHPSSYNTIRPGQGRMVHVNTVVNLDGHRLATVVSHHQASSMNGPLAGGTHYDGSMAYTPTAATGGFI